MRTIKLLGVDTLHEQEGLKKAKTRPLGIGLQKMSFVPVSDRPGYIRFLPLTPSWPNYVGIDFYPREGNAAALIDADEQYRFFDGEEWAIADTPIYQDISVIREGLGQWAGNLQVEVEVANQLQSVAIAYDVDLDLTPYLLEYGIPDLLSSSPVNIVRRRRTSPTGKINLGVLDLEAITVVAVKTLEGQTGEFTPDAKGTITTPWPNRMVEVKVSLKPFCDFVFAEYQITRLPTVLLHLLPEERIRYPSSTFTCIDLGDGTSEETGVSRIVDMVVEVRVTAEECRDAIAIANQLFSLIRQVQAIDAAPFDESYPVVAIGGVSLTEGLPPAATFRFQILNLPIETYAIKNLTIENIDIHVRPFPMEVTPIVLGTAHMEYRGEDLTFS